MANLPGDAGYAEAIQFLYSRINYEQSPPASPRKVDLHPMRILLGRLGDPQLGLPAIHIAGTKGKGSTAAMSSAVLTAAGYRTGLYTSPHLSRLEERFAINGQPCTPQELVELTAAIRPVVDEVDRVLESEARQLTFFEITTAMMWLHFVQREVDAVVLEVGMGGRLDSTNLCRPIVTVITSISFDHTKQLGNTLAAIAAEKAGIIKQGIPIVSGVIDEEPRRVIASTAQQYAAPLYQLGVDFHANRAATLVEQPCLDRSVSGKSHHDTGTWPKEAAAVELPSGEVASTVFDYVSSVDQSRSLNDVQLAIPGRHQASNAAVSLAALSCLKQQGWRINEQAIRQGLATVQCRGRIEVVSRSPTVILDTAHNVSSISVLIDTLRESFAAERRFAIFAASRDKDVSGMLRLLSPYFDVILLTRFLSNPRAHQPERLASLLRECCESIERCPEVIIFQTPEAAWSECTKRLRPNDLACITGSFFLAAELEPLVRHKPIPC